MTNQFGRMTNVPVEKVDPVVKALSAAIKVNKIA
jgi:hypothetical protein